MIPWLLPVSNCPITMIGPGGLLLVVSQLFAVCFHLWEKTLIKMIPLLFPVSNWSITMIRLGGLLLVVSQLFAVPLSETKLEHEIYFCRVTYWVLLGMLLGGHLAIGFAWKPKTILELIKRLKGVLMKVPGSLVFSLSSNGGFII
jgi:hypothetical protein